MAYVKEEHINHNKRRIWGTFILSDGSRTHFEMKRGESWFQWGNTQDNLCETVNRVEKLCNEWREYSLPNPGRSKSERFYIRWFYPDYNINLLSRAVKQMGGKNVRTCRQFGWSNQPELVTFSVPNYYMAQMIEKELARFFPQVIIYKQDW